MRNWRKSTGFTARKWFMLFFFGGFGCGIALANLFGRQYLNNIGIISDYFIHKYQYMEIQNQRLLSYIMGQRLGAVALLWFLGLTVLGVAAACLCSAWMGFSIGILLSAATMRFGFGGLLVFVGAVLPQYLFYAPALMLLLFWANRICGRLYFARGEYGAEQSNRRMILDYVLVFLVAMALYLAGIFLESYVNPLVFRRILHWF